MLHRSFNLRGRRYLFDFLASRYTSYMVSGILGVAAAAIIWSMLPHKSNVSAAVRPASPAFHPDSIVIAQQVAMAHLFGHDVAAGSPMGSAAATNISVEGIIYSEDKDSGLAILKVDGNTDIFRVGDALPDGEKLLAIAPTAVEIGSQGAPRVLAMQRDFGDGGGPLLAGIVGAPSQNDFFPDLRMAAPSAAYAPALRPVLLSPGSDPLSQLRSLRQQLIRQGPPISPAHPVKHPSKP